MPTAYSLSYSADAAATLARARAAGIGGSSFQVTVSTRKLDDGVFNAFCQVSDSSTDKQRLVNQAQQSLDRFLRMVELYPWMLSRYPWVKTLYPQIFKGKPLDSYDRTVH